MVIYEPDQVCLKRLRGSVQVPAEKTEVPGRAGVLIEVKPDRATGPLRIWKTTSKRKGKFRITGLNNGDYIMKVTLDGFQSVYQRVRISAECPSDEDLTIDLKLGL